MCIRSPPPALTVQGTEFEYIRIDVLHNVTYSLYRVTHFWSRTIKTRPSSILSLPTIDRTVYLMLRRLRRSSAPVQFFVCSPREQVRTQRTFSPIHITSVVQPGHRPLRNASLMFAVLQLDLFGVFCLWHFLIIVCSCPFLRCRLRDHSLSWMLPLCTVLYT